MRQLFSIFAFCLFTFGMTPPTAADGGVIRLIVPSPAGGLPDGLARVLGNQLKLQTGETFVVENKPGASTAIGMRDCGLAKPDGRTFCVTVADSLSYNPHAFANLSYDPEKFIGVAHLGEGTALLFANARSGFSSYKDMLTAAKNSPGRVFFATFGDASRPDVIRRWTNLKAEVEVAGVPYRGFTPATQALVAGEVHIGYMGAGNAKNFVDAGVIRPIAVVGTSRVAAYPTVPTLDELGLDISDLPTYFGLYAPPGTSAEIVARMHANVQNAMESGAMKKFFETYGLGRLNMSQQQFDQYVRVDRRKAGEVFKTLGIKPGAIPE